METNIWIEVVKIVGAIAAGAGFWAWVKAREDKRKTPYDMLMEMMAEQKRFYAQKNAEFEREKKDSSEKSYILAQSRKCAHRFKDPATPCPVDEANEARLQKKCENCSYNKELEQ